MQQKAGAEGGFDGLQQQIDAPRGAFSYAFHGSAHQSFGIDGVKASSTYKERAKHLWGQHFSNPGSGA